MSWIWFPKNDIYFRFKFGIDSVYYSAIAEKLKNQISNTNYTDTQEANNT